MQPRSQQVVGCFNPQDVRSDVVLKEVKKSSGEKEDKPFAVQNPKSDESNSAGQQATELPAEHIDEPKSEYERLMSILHKPAKYSISSSSSSSSPRNKINQDEFERANLTTQTQTFDQNLVANNYHSSDAFDLNSKRNSHVFARNDSDSDDFFK